MSSDGFYIIVDDTFGPYKHCKDCGTLWTDSILRCPQCGSGFFKFARKQYENNAAAARDLALVTRAVKMALEEAAHAYCEQCRSGDEPMPYEYKNAKGFVHGVYHCKASRIRALDAAAIAEEANRH